MQFETIPVTRMEQNCSILWCEVTNRAAIIDPGGDLHLILDLLEWNDLTLEVILVTHGHYDHAGSAARLAAETDARTEGPHRGDAHLLAGLSDYAASRGVKADSYIPGRWLEHGDQVRFGEEFLDVLHCPGHTKGHVAYFSPSARWAFVGDILFRGAIGAWEHRDGDLPTLIDSIRNRLFPLGDDVRFVPGHGETSTFGRERAENPFVGDAAMAALEARRAARAAAT
ncbi:MAG TPA: MBL fold metallo-hydrolase [Sphingobium sp.]|uniref:MBL fold metallo-hydrolase n=1 Tax=Sphingobium sp. TaxID=1912891 RepID=UPI002ED11A53